MKKEGTIFFSLDAWADALPEHVRKVFPFLIVPRASKREKNEGLDGFEEKDSMKWQGGNEMVGLAGTYPDGTPRPKQLAANTHATVKPLTLMSYLITLGSRPGDTILDPFMGSGTTGVAAKQLNREFIGIELDPEYLKIAEARINNVNVQLKI